MNCASRIDRITGVPYLAVGRARALLSDPLTNKGTASPPAERVYETFKAKATDLARSIYAATVAGSMWRPVCPALRYEPSPQRDAAHAAAAVCER